MIKFKSILIIGLILLNASCDIFPEKIEYDDAELKPYLKAIAQIDRKSMGFTEIEKDADISLERNSKSEKGYDRMLHIYGSTSRTVSFKLIENNDYEWIGEQEIFEGPNEFETLDGIFKENIILTYEKSPISGHKLNELNIEYRGENKLLTNKANLTIEKIKPFLKQWTSGK
jgi:hypothetical protein